MKLDRKELLYATNRLINELTDLVWETDYEWKLTPEERQPYLNHVAAKNALAAAKESRDQLWTFLSLDD